VVKGKEVLNLLPGLIDATNNLKTQKKRMDFKRIIKFWMYRE
jgi:hypothetical protein